MTMSAPHSEGMPAPSPLLRAAAAAGRRIAPTWPLDRFIAVNPWWGFVDRPLPDAAARLARLCGARTTMPLPWYLDAFERGQITPAALAEAMNRLGLAPDTAALRRQADLRAVHDASRLLLTTVLDDKRSAQGQPALTGLVIQAIGQHCASWFDRGQARWRPAASPGLYASWRASASHDHGLSLLSGISGLATRIARLPDTPEALLTEACDALGLAGLDLEDYFTALLLSVNGWAAWCAYQRWQAQPCPDQDAAPLLQLLAIRLAWEWLLADTAAEAGQLADWRAGLHGSRTAIAPDPPWIWQEALELTWQERIHQGLASARPDCAPARPCLQAVFCIDVRSEPVRRALESRHPGIRTHGFAGFFGLPLEYRPPGSTDTRPHLPGLLTPRLRAVAQADTPARTLRIEDRLRRRLQQADAWHGVRASASGGFGFVESLGLFYLWKLVRDSLGLAKPASPDGVNAREQTVLKPVLDGITLAQAADLAASVLGAMSLGPDLARRVLLVGHGSQTANNPHAAGLDCGACCGQTGEVNARVLATLLNQPDVRSALAARGYAIPADTLFIAALHNTTTDVFTLFDVPADIDADLDPVRLWLDEASASARRQRAASLGIRAGSDAALARAFRRRSADWSEVRPEWGLANNAGFIAAPRSRSRHLDLEGRCFLHDYEAGNDPDYRVLELILTAPVVVAHWINLQYYASTVDNRRWGSGDKTLHNVVGGNIGVFEGNGGDLRIGLPLQSLHDGARWMHTPLRLTVWVEAPCAAVEAILQRHDTVRRLVTGGWLHLFCIEPGGNRIRRRRRGKAAAGEPWVDWQPVTP